MQVQTTEVEYCKLEVLYTADQEVVQSKREDALASLRDVQIPGFRKGKAPEFAIKATLGKKLDVLIAEQMKAKAYDDVIFETEAKPIGYPVFEDVKISGNDFSCKVVFYKKPEFELKDFKYEIPRPASVLDKDVEVQRALEDLRLRFGDVNPYQENDFVEVRDQVTLGFSATIDGKPFEGSEVEGQLYVVGSNALPGFDDNLLGMQAGETREFNLTFPENYGDLSSKTAVFKVNLFMGAKKIPCALDDELAKKCGVESLELLTEQLGKIANVKIQQSEGLKIRQQVATRLVQDHDFKCPEFLVTIEAQHLSYQDGVVWSSLSEDEQKLYKEQAEKQVKLSFILDSIREQEPDAVLSDMEIRNGLAKRAQMQGKDPEQFLVEAQKNGTLLGLMSGLKDEYTMQYVISQSKVVE